MALGSWNSPPDFIRAMSSGASAGLQARGQDIAQSEAADRLSLAYSQLASEEASRNERAKQTAELAQQRMSMENASNLLKAHQMDMLSQWRQQQLAQQATAVDALNKYRTGELKLGQDKLNKPALHFGTQGEVLKEDPETGGITQVRPPRVGAVRPTPFDLQSHSSLLSEENALQKALTMGGVTMDDDTKLKALNRIGQIRKQRAALESKYARPNPQVNPAAGTTPLLDSLAPQSGTSAAASKRLKVKGPGGASGTVPSGTTLPEGWSIIDQENAEPTQPTDEEEEE